jgi:hypothetical protein
MSMKRQKILEELNAIEEPKLIHEGSYDTDSIVRVISGEGGYSLEIDEFPISGPFNISEDEFLEFSKFVEEGEDAEGYLDPSEDQMEMVEAGCEPEIPYYRYQLNERDEEPVFSEDREELEAKLIEDVMALGEFIAWEEVNEADLQEWYLWHRENEV